MKKRKIVLSIMITVCTMFCLCGCSQKEPWNIKQINAINDIQKTKQCLGIGDGKVYEPEKVPERFAENLIKAGRTYIVGILK